MKPDKRKIKTALISVYDKTGVVDFARRLELFGVGVYSTGGTAKILIEAGVNVTTISELTGFPEILGGRVKTLHPKIHAGLLAKLDDEIHAKQMDKHSIESIDLLVVNLYPFEETLEKGASDEEIIENIDIGGPSMLRAAAKNYKWTAPISNPSQYETVLDFLRKDGTIPLDYRKKLAEEAFNLTSYYDSLIAEYWRKKNSSKIPKFFGLPLKKENDLRYGENPHQEAAAFGKVSKIFQKLHGKELSFNNLVDIDAAANLILEFDEPAVAIIKHTNPCGVGLDDDLSKAFQKAFETDNVSPFGGIIAVNGKIDAAFANTVHSLFTEVIIAPDYEDEALEILKQKKNRRLLKIDFDALKNSSDYILRSITGGFLYQKADNLLFDENSLKVATKREPTEEEKKALFFAWKVVKHVKSNAIVFAKADRTLAIGAGQMSRVDSARIAVEKARLMGLDLEGSVLASDAFFPFPDAVEQAADAGATAIIQPGGSIRDGEVVKAADERDIAMIFTGFRHFKH